MSRGWSASANASCAACAESLRVSALEQFGFGARRDGCRAALSRLWFGGTAAPRSKRPVTRTRSERRSSVPATAVLEHWRLVPRTFRRRSTTGGRPRAGWWRAGCSACSSEAVAAPDRRLPDAAALLERPEEEILAYSAVLGRALVQAEQPDPLERRNREIARGAPTTSGSSPATPRPVRLTNPAIASRSASSPPGLPDEPATFSVKQRRDRGGGSRLAPAKRERRSRAAGPRSSLKCARWPAYGYFRP